LFFLFSSPMFEHVALSSNEQAPIFSELLIFIASLDPSS
jgi:hypothetical protein